MPDPNPRVEGAHLVGSVNLENSEAVFRAGVLLDGDEGAAAVELFVDVADEAADLPEVLVEFEEVDDVDVVGADDIGEFSARS